MPFGQRLCDLLSAAVQREQSAQRIPSISAAYVRNGAVEWADAVGRVDGRADGEVATVDTQYRIGSITKTFVAVLVLRLVDQEAIALDDPLERHVPGTPLADVPIVDLLSQRSGLRAETDGPWWERSPGVPFSDLEHQLAIRASARGVFHYSNVGFAVLAELVGRVSGRPWTEVLRAEILVPLGMDRTTLRPQPPYAVGLAVHPHADLVHDEPEHDAGAMAGAGQLWSTTADLGRWAHALHAGTAELLHADTLAAMKTPRSWADLRDQPWTSAYGLGLEVFNSDGRRRYGHGGSMPGFQAGLQFDAATGDAVITMYNTTSGLSGTLPQTLRELVDEHAPTPPAVWCADPEQQDLRELTGGWFWGPASLTIRARPAGEVELVPVGHGRGSRFRPTGPDRWVGLDGYYRGEPLQLIRREGRVSHWDLASFRLTRTPYDPEADLPGGAGDGWR